MKIFIPYNTPSSKNSKQLVWAPSKKEPGKKTPIFTDSKVTKRYKKNTGMLYKMNAKRFREAYDAMEKPVKVSFKFFRDSKRKFDYINPMQTVQDMMVTYEWIEDDNADCIIPICEQYEINKQEPGVLITLIENE
jgi:hypothetical protein